MDAGQLLHLPFSFLWGPPGTGKTYTMGALLASVLLEQPKTRVLLLSSTNRAVDEALLSVDDQLASLRLTHARAQQLRERIKRYGQNYDAARYKGRKHLLCSSTRESLIAEIALHRQNEPRKQDAVAYATWKERLQSLRSQIPKPDLAAPLLAMTATAAIYVFDHLEKDKFDYVIFDEASQISRPYACALATLGKRVLFAGDPQQLAPIVVSKNGTARSVLGKSPFTYKGDANCCQLEEQNRVAYDICAVVSDMFYSGKLRVADGCDTDRV